MSKGKYQRKRKHARQKAQQQVNEVGFPYSEVIPPEKKPESPKKSDSEQDKKKENLMGFSEIVKRSSFTDWCIAAFTLVLTVVASYTLSVTIGQLDTMRKDQRPWVKMTAPTSGTLNENTTIIGNIQLDNSGKTPAKNVFVRAFVQKLGKDEEPTLTYEKPYPSELLGVLYPNAPTGPTNSLEYGVAKEGEGGLLKFEPIGKDDLKKFSDGNLYYAIYGEVTYTDFFRTQHWTHFCTWAAIPSPPRIFQSRKCIEYNEVDDN